MFWLFFLWIFDNCREFLSNIVNDCMLYLFIFFVAQQIFYKNLFFMPSFTFFAKSMLDSQKYKAFKNFLKSQYGFLKFAKCLFCSIQRYKTNPLKIENNL